MPTIHDLDETIRIIYKWHPNSPPPNQLRESILKWANMMLEDKEISSTSTLGYLLKRSREEGEFELWIAPWLLAGKI